MVLHLDGFSRHTLPEWETKWETKRLHRTLGRHNENRREHAEVGRILFRIHVSLSGAPLVAGADFPQVTGEFDGTIGFLQADIFAGERFILEVIAGLKG